MADDVRVRVDRSGSYEGPALEWLYAEACRLRDVLSGAGIADPRVQMKICEDYIFGLSYGFDHDSVEVEGQAFRAELAFAANDQLLLPDRAAFEFHDYAIGCAREPFED